jgi:signal transduction histidine kinase
VVGAAEQRLRTRSRTVALGLRLVVIGLSSSVSLVLAAIPDRAVTAGVVLGFNLWSLAYASAMIRGTARLRRWLPLADIAVVCAVCLAQPWTVTSDPRGGATWVFVAVNMVAVTYPWQVDGPLLGLATAAIVVSYHFGTVLADPGGWLVNPSIGAWTVAEAVLSWALCRFVMRSARSADQIIERGARLRRAADIAAARRAGEREYLAALHDTAAATLLMVGSGVAARPEPRLAEQARRDLRELERYDDAALGETDMIPLLHEVARTSAVRVAWRGPATVTLPAADAVALSRGVREALTNVARHAGTEHAEVRVSQTAETVRVEVVDSGRGFDPAAVSGERYGVRHSLLERMLRIGGRARIESRPGHGTTVTLTAERGDQEPAADDRAVIVASFQRGLRRAVVVVSAAILLVLDLSHLLTSPGAYFALWPQFVAWSGLLAVTVVAGVAAWRDRPLGRWRLPLLVLVFALSALATESIRPEYLLGWAHWSEGDAGWQVVLLMMDAPVGAFAAVLGAQYLMTFGQAALAGQAALSVPGAVSASWTVVAFQVAIAMTAAVLRNTAAGAAREVRATERLRTAETIARHLHVDRNRRLSALATTAVPLLEGLASGDLDPGDQSVRALCAAEAARMRRLIAEAAGDADPLAHELRACIESAENNGTTVSFAECGTRPELPTAVRRRLLEPAIAALATARGKARVTVVGGPGTVTVSVVAVCDPPPAAPESDGVRWSVEADGERLWVRADWQAEQ